MKRVILFMLAVCGVLFYTTLLVADEGKEHKPAAAQKDTAEAVHEHGEESEIDEKTVQGEFIDITCYVRHDSKGPNHLKCAEYCASLSMPFGLLEDGTNKIYLILPGGHDNPTELIMPYIEKKVKVDGIIYTMGGLTGFEIQEIEEIKH